MGSELADLNLKATLYYLQELASPGKDSISRSLQGPKMAKHQKYTIKRLDDTITQGSCWLPFPPNHFRTNSSICINTCLRSVSILVQIFKPGVLSCGIKKWDLVPPFITSLSFLYTSKQTDFLKHFVFPIGGNRSKQSNK